MTYYIYILTCSNNALYTGYTTDIERRYAEHVSGSPKCKYTRSFPPQELSACWQIDGELSDALKIEKAIKQCSKTDKLRIIQSTQILKTMLIAKNIDSQALASLKKLEETEDYLISS